MVSKNLSRAISEMNSGALNSAALISRKSILENPDGFNEWMVFGLINSKITSPRSSSDAFLRAHLINLNHKDAIRNYVASLMAIEEPVAAEKFLSGVIRKNFQPEFLSNLLNLQLSAGDRHAAIKTASQILLFHPTDQDALSLVAETSDEPDLSRKIALSKRALANMPNHMAVLSSLGFTYVKRDRLGDLGKAAVAFRHALEIDPTFLPVRAALGEVVRSSGNSKDAIDVIRPALLLAPNSIEAWTEYLKACELANELKLGASVIERGSIVGGSDIKFQSQAVIMEDRLEKQVEAVSRAKTILNQKIDPKLEATAIVIEKDMGVILDKIGEYESAFTAIENSNRRFLRRFPEYTGQAERYRSELKQISHFVKRHHAHLAQPSPPGENSPVFLVGFPRSGTTLLDQILDSHSDAAVLEEQGTLEQAFGLADRSIQDSLELFRNLNPSEREYYQQEYWSYLDAYLPARTGVTRIDKFPLRLVFIYFIQQVFPDARFIVALRHPCDCCLSGFMQRFALNPAMANFLDIETSFKLYGDVMELWRTARDILKPNHIEVRYEYLVEDLPFQRHRILDYLGLSTKDPFVQPHVHAQDRPGINTPSLRQVTQPIYTRASGRWKRYEKKLKPFTDIIRPYAEELGYNV